MAEELEIYAVIAYTSEHATSTATYVAERLGLPTNPYKSIDLLSNKGKYRSFWGGMVLMSLEHVDINRWKMH